MFEHQLPKPDSDATRLYIKYPVRGNRDLIFFRVIPSGKFSTTVRGKFVLQLEGSVWETPTEFEDYLNRNGFKGNCYFITMSDWLSVNGFQE